MPFGQPPGPPATARQVNELLALLNQAGHTDFRDARGPMGFTQRQAGGRFTRDEAAALIEQLQAGEAPPDAVEPGTPDPTPTGAPAPRRPPAAPAAPAGGVDRMLRDIPAPRLAAELQRRGWMAIEPIEGT